jgi:hypothetical protein
MPKSVLIPQRGRLMMLTRGLLLAVTSDGADDRVDLASNAVGSALDVALGLRGVVLSLAGGVLLLAGLLPRRGAGNVADLQDRWMSG